MADITFYNSVMNSGKSAQLIMKAYNLRKKGKRVGIYKSNIDTRDYGIIKSRAIETSMYAEVIDNNLDLLENIGEHMFDFIFVDEVNFLTKEQIDSIVEASNRFNIPVYMYGLLTDYRGLLFEGSKRAVEVADNIVEIEHPCEFCNDKATMHLLKIDGEYVFDGDGVLIGDTNFYNSVCRSCYIKARKGAQWQ